VTAISVGYSFNGCSGVQTFSNLNLETAPAVTCIPGPCPNTVSSYRAFSYSAGSIDGPFTTVNGLFTLLTRAEGQVAFRDYPGCGTAVGIGWTATKPWTRSIERAEFPTDTIVAGWTVLVDEARPTPACSRRRRAGSWAAAAEAARL